MADTKTLEGKCLCGSVHFTLQIPTSVLPLKTYMCHCSTCRYATGGPCIFHAALPETLRPVFIAPSSEKNMKSFRMENCGYTLNFCSTCGCHITAIGLDDGSWTVSTSVLNMSNADVVNYSSHVFSKSAKDGGVSDVITRISGKDVPSWNPPDDDPSSKPTENEPGVGPDGQERLRAKCRCGGVSFTIARPQAEDSENPFVKQHVVSATNPLKWMASLDVCDDCRLTTGTTVVAWTFVCINRIEPKMPLDFQFGTMKTYKSSEDVLRSFCGDCGATIFYYDVVDPRKTNVVDIAVGILRAPEGPMADNWLTWRNKVAHADNGRQYDEAFTNAVVTGMTKWTEDRYGVAV
ncbi:hypothetical protein VHEMI04980 [[Torrubiella] hemipterigena]|uniref:CENP-V/GFA domain-containing protein n=1 Tax=[Torrubiella] hemipterigena TaxID=1531966 RepID=A0A0A1THM9_9HYPO|nr:hypothetical protein VHEMI04980 [[Torrubiella] hemipterigena]